jgi:predicted negative regulator of RcsB-dependent stress response
MCKSRPETKSEDEAPKQNYSRFFSVLSFIFISLHLCKGIINKDLLYIMAKKIKTNVENPQELENLENAVLTSEAFIEKHQKKLMIAFGVIIALIAGWLGYHYLIEVPANNEAAEMMVKGQEYFMTNQYKEAVEGDSIEYIGFVAIAEEYSNTPSGDLANAYAGISYYRLGEYDKAMTYLMEYDGDSEELKATTKGTIGDCYVQKGDMENAIKSFQEAAECENSAVAVIYLFKLARVYESLNQNDKALEIYRQIKADYKGIVEGNADVDNIDKFIEALSK